MKRLFYLIIFTPLFISGGIPVNECIPCLSELILQEEVKVRVDSFYRIKAIQLNEVKAKADTLQWLIAEEKEKRSIKRKIIGRIDTVKFANGDRIIWYWIYIIRLRDTIFLRTYIKN